MGTLIATNAVNELKKETSFVESAEPNFGWDNRLTLFKENTRP
jgi:hypothetical protein